MNVPLKLKIDGKEYTLMEIQKLTGFTRARLYKWHLNGYFEKMIPAIKREMEKNHGGNKDSDITD